jgi:hypothetical protein
VVRYTVDRRAGARTDPLFFSPIETNVCMQGVHLHAHESGHPIRRIRTAPQPPFPHEGMIGFD